MILVILLQYFCLCIYDIYLYIPICSIYVYEYAVYIYSRLYMVCNWNSSDFLGVVYWHATSKAFTHFQPTKTMVNKVP